MRWLRFFLIIGPIKFPSILLIYYTFEVTNYNILILMSLVVGRIFGLNNILIQKLLSYSSLIHLCWLFISLNFSVNFFIY